MLADHGVRVTEGTDSHLSCIGLPCIEHCMNLKRVVGVKTIEAEGFLIGDNEIALGRLVVVEFYNLRTAFALPEVGNFFKRVNTHSAILIFVHKKCVGAVADKELNVKVKFSLLRRVQRDREGRMLPGSLLVTSKRIFNWAKIRL